MGLIKQGGYDSEADNYSSSSKVSNSSGSGGAHFLPHPLPFSLQPVKVPGVALPLSALSSSSSSSSAAASAAAASAAAAAAASAAAAPSQGVPPSSLQSSSSSSLSTTTATATDEHMLSTPAFPLYPLGDGLRRDVPHTDYPSPRRPRLDLDAMAAVSGVSGMGGVGVGGVGLAGSPSASSTSSASAIAAAAGGAGAGAGAAPFSPSSSGAAAAGTAGRASSRGNGSSSSSSRQGDVVEVTSPGVERSKEPPCDDPTKYCGFCCKVADPLELVSCCQCGNSGP